MNTTSRPEKPTIPYNTVAHWFSDGEAASMLRYLSDFPTLTRSDVYTLCYLVKQLELQSRLPVESLKLLVVEASQQLRDFAQASGEEEFISDTSHLYARLRFLPAREVARLCFAALLALSQPAGANQLIWFNLR